MERGSEFTILKLTSTLLMVEYWFKFSALLAAALRTSSEWIIWPLEMRDTDDGSAWNAGTGTLNAFACGEMTIGGVLWLRDGCWANCDWMNVKLAADKFGAGYWWSASLRGIGDSVVRFIIDWIFVVADGFNGLKAGTPSGSDCASVIACGVFRL